MAVKKSFVIRHENAEQFDMLADEQLGKLFRAMYRFSESRVEPSFDDPMLKMLFSIVRGQIERDTEKYEETCKKRAESGKKGGRPTKANGFSENQKKANGFLENQKKAKKADTECECECECVPECDPVTDSVCECECDPVRMREDHTAHTPHTAQELTVEWVLEFSGKCGYSWTSGEAKKFIKYNRDRGRTDDWDYAFERWEKNRPIREKASGKSKSKNKMPQRELENMDDYLSLVNRFKEDENDDTIQP